MRATVHRRGDTELRIEFQWTLSSSCRAPEWGRGVCGGRDLAVAGSLGDPGSRSHALAGACIIRPARPGLAVVDLWFHPAPPDTLMPCVLTGLVNFERAPGELYVELAPHPGGYGYLLFEEILSLRACFRCRSRVAARELLQDVAVPIVTVPGRCLRGQ